MKAEKRAFLEGLAFEADVEFPRVLALTESSLVGESSSSSSSELSPDTASLGRSRANLDDNDLECVEGSGEDRAALFAVVRDKWDEDGRGKENSTLRCFPLGRDALFFEFGSPNSASEFDLLISVLRVF
jgi:hypothetical protein